MYSFTFALLPLFLSSVSTSPAPKPAAAAVAGPAPTPAPEFIPTPTIEERDLASDVESVASAASDYAGSVLSSLGTAVPSYVSDGVLPFFQGLPTGTAVESSLGTNDTAIAALPTEVLNIP